VEEAEGRVNVYDYSPVEPYGTRCGEFYLYHYEEQKGPRGGRRTAWFALCARCGRKSAARASVRPGSGGDEVLAGRDELRANECDRPFVPNTGARMLHALAGFITRAETISLPFAVEHLQSRSLREATLAAWSDCNDGYAMTELITAHTRRVLAHRTLSGASIGHNGKMHGTLDVKGSGGVATVSLNGPRETIAEVLERMVDDDAVAKIAALAEPKGVAA
jgi:hypothetical protein